MKQLTGQYIVGLISIVAAAAVSSCASSGSDSSTAPVSTAGTTGTTTTTATTTTTTGSGTGTVSLNASAAALSAMFFNSGASSPTNIQFSMSTYDSGNGYAGSVTISYTDVNGTHTANLTTTNPVDSATSNAQYNVWLNSTQWHGFFQDQWGAVIVVIDGSTSTGDGSSGNLSGSVWFQNFGTAAAAQGWDRMCWQIDPINGATTTPYDCRSFLTSYADGSMPDTTSSLYPTNAGQGRPLYAKLGTFTGLSQSAAFGQ